MSTSDEPKNGLCIVSFDSGGPGSISQLLMMKQLMNRLEYELGEEENTLCPADHFDLMGGAGYGAICGFLLGPLHMTPEEAMEELTSIALEIFPNDTDEIITPRARLMKLQIALENTLERRGLPITMKLNDKKRALARCKVVAFAATTDIMSHCHPFRTYRSRHGSTDCTFVEAACAALAEPELFSPIPIGRSSRQQSFAGTPMGFSNPIRMVLEEARLQFGNDRPISVLLSLGSGQPAPLSLRLFPVAARGRYTLLTRLVSDCERTAKEFEKELADVEAYLRLSVDKGLENLTTGDWYRLGTIVSHTDAYLRSPSISDLIDASLRLLQSRASQFTAGELGQASTMVAARTRFERQYSDLAVQIKGMCNIIQQGGEKVTLIDAIGNRVSIPMDFCRTYEVVASLLRSACTRDLLGVVSSSKIDTNSCMVWIVKLSIRCYGTPALFQEQLLK